MSAYPTQGIQSSSVVPLEVNPTYSTNHTSHKDISIHFKVKNKSYINYLFQASIMYCNYFFYFTVCMKPKYRILCNKHTRLIKAPPSVRALGMTFVYKNDHNFLAN